MKQLHMLGPFKIINYYLKNGREIDKLKYRQKVVLFVWYQCSGSIAAWQVEVWLEQSQVWK